MEQENNNATSWDSKGKGHNKGSGFGGKYQEIPQKLRDALRSPMPKGAITKHPTKTYLSTVKAIFVAERLHDVFGFNGWEIEHAVVGAGNGYVLMKGRIYLRKFDLYTPYQFGGHGTEGRGTEAADGYKSAVTDIQSKCGAHLEIAIDVFKGNPEATVLTPSTPVNIPAGTPKSNPSGLDKPKADKPKKKISPKVKKEIEEAEMAVAEVCDVNLEKHFIEIDDYQDHKELAENAEAIVFNAQMDGANPEQIKEIKEAINERYTKLKG